MPELTIRGVTLSPAARQKPRIIVPIMADTVEEAVQQAKTLALPRWEGVAELVELRLDPLLGAGAHWQAALEQLRGTLRPAQPLIATIRTKREGGLADLTPQAYAQACRAVLDSEARPDLLDVEFSAGEETVTALLAAAHAAGVAVILSEHHFDGTPAGEDITRQLCAMADAGADIAKLAVMANTRTDADTLLQATARAAAARPDTPRLTMAMGPRGTVTRVCGGLFGSCATFGSVGKISAPGQPNARALWRALRTMEQAVTT